MKRKMVWLFTAVFCIIAAGCTTTKMESNKVGWSDYASITVKDYDVLGIISLKSEVKRTVGPLGLSSSNEGSEITYAMLMKEAAKMKGDDVINVRIDKSNENTRHIFSNLTGYTDVITYTATALVIRYKDADADVGTSQFKKPIKEEGTSSWGLMQPGSLNSGSLFYPFF